MTRKRDVVKLSLALIFFCAAPTVGDIGSCGQSSDDLDPVKFFASKQEVDCEQCMSCGIDTNACTAACGNKQLITAFPDGCEPLVHDGEVCLDALLAASCSTYRAYVADQGATTPTECDFCPEGP